MNPPYSFPAKDSEDHTPPLFGKGEAFRLLLVFIFLFIGLVTISFISAIMLFGAASVHGPVPKLVLIEGSLILSTLFMVRRVQQKRVETQSEETLAPYLGLFGPADINWRFVIKWTLLLLLLHLFITGSGELNGSQLDLVDRIAETGLFLTFFGLVVVAPITEEILFRGILYPALHDSTNRPKLSAFVTSITFAAIHFDFSIASMISRTLLGWLFLRGRTVGGSLYVSIWLHALQNFCVFSGTILYLTRYG